MTRGVALPPVRYAVMPDVWASICCERGVVAALDAIEAAADEAQRQGERLRAKGPRRYAQADLYQRQAEALRRDACFFADAHS